MKEKGIKCIRCSSSAVRSHCALWQARYPLCEPCGALWQSMNHNIQKDYLDTLEFEQKRFLGVVLYHQGDIPTLPPPKPPEKTPQKEEEDFRQEITKPGVPAKMPKKDKPEKQQPETDSPRRSWKIVP